MDAKDVGEVSRLYIDLRISIQTAGLAFVGTGLCSYRVRCVDGSCAKHLTVESYTVIYAANSYIYYYFLQHVVSWAR